MIAREHHEQTSAFGVKLLATLFVPVALLGPAGIARGTEFTLAPTGSISSASYWNSWLALMRPFVAAQFDVDVLAFKDVGRGTRAAQRFTVQGSYGTLESVELLVEQPGAWESDPGDLIVELYRAGPSPSLFSGAPLATASLPFSNTITARRTRWMRFAFERSVAVAPGQTYVLVVTTSSDSRNYYGLAMGAASYEDGFHRAAGLYHWYGIGGNFAFRAWVRPWSVLTLAP
jgi:hypothetical protein